MTCSVFSVRDRETFAALRRPDRRGRSGPLNVSYCARPDGPPAVAYAVGRRCGGAVVRNRLRRRLRAAARAAAPGLAPGAYLVRVDPPAAALPYADLARNLENALFKAGKCR